MKAYFNYSRVIAIICLAGSILLSGCKPSDYVDVSHETKYQKIIGSEYITKQDIKAIGVTFDQNYKKRVDVVHLVENPGFSGPEVVFSEILNKGSKIKIDGVFESHHLFSVMIYYKVKIIDPEKYENYMVQIYDVGDVESESMGINEEIFKKMM